MSPTTSASLPILPSWSPGSWRIKQSSANATFEEQYDQVIAKSLLPPYDAAASSAPSSGAAWAFLAVLMIATLAVVTLLAAALLRGQARWMSLRTIVVVTLVATLLHDAGDVPARIRSMTPVEVEFTLNRFRSNTSTGKSSTMSSDVVATIEGLWRRRVFCPMLIFRPELQTFKEAIERALPSHVVAFDLVFQPEDGAVLWHSDYDSLGPFDVSTLSIARQDFVTVHVNLVNEAGGGQLRTMGSFAVSAAVLLYGSLGFIRDSGSGQRAFQIFVSDVFNCAHRLSDALFHFLGDRQHDPSVGVANVFNNLAPHSVTPGPGRISYVVRLVKRDVLLSRANVEGLITGTRGTRPHPEFEPFLSHFANNESAAAGEFPFRDVRA